MCSTHSMRAARGVLAAVALIVGAGAVAGCGSSLGSEVSSPASGKPGRAGVSVAVPFRSPEQAALWWFAAINHKDKAAVVAHFARGGLRPGSGYGRACMGLAGSWWPCCVGGLGGLPAQLTAWLALLLRGWACGGLCQVGSPFDD
jgi:hypothetical protein